MSLKSNPGFKAPAVFRCASSEQQAEANRLRASVEPAVRIADALGVLRSAIHRLLAQPGMPDACRSRPVKSTRNTRRRAQHYE